MRLTCSLALAAAGLMLAASGPARADETKAKCPVSGHEVTVTAKTPIVMVNGNKIVFCCENCPKAFAASPEKYIADAGKCPVAGQKAKLTKETRLVLNNNLYYTCCGGCPDQFTSDPSKWVKELKDPVTGKSFKPTSDSPREEVSGQIYVFADNTSKAAFDKDNSKYVVVYK